MGEPIIIAGPCVIEDYDSLETIAQELVRLENVLGINIIFKASFDKANRTSLHSYRGPGLERGLSMLQRIKSKYDLHILTDIHESYQAALVSDVADIIQIPAFLSRQTDLIVAAAQTGKILNIKKGQFLSGKQMRFPVEKARQAGANQVWLTERGNILAYDNLIVDFRNIFAMKEITPTVIMDCTHSTQMPCSSNETTGGDCRFILPMALAAKAFGANGFFFEVHPKPEKALSDGATMLKLNELENVLRRII